MSGGTWSVKGWDSLTGSDLWSGNGMLCMAQSPWVQMMAEMWQHLKGRAAQPHGSLCEYLGILAAVLAFSPGLGSLWSDLVHAACMCAWKLVKAALVSHVHWLSNLFCLTVTVKFSHSSVSSFEQLYTVIHSGSILFGFCWSLCYGWFVTFTLCREVFSASAGLLWGPYVFHPFCAVCSFCLLLYLVSPPSLKNLSLSLSFGLNHKVTTTLGMPLWFLPTLYYCPLAKFFPKVK